LASPSSSQDASPGTDGNDSGASDAPTDVRGSSYAEVVLGDGPVLYYRLGDDAGATVAAEVHGPSNDGVYEPSKVTAQAALVGDPDTATWFGSGHTTLVRLQPSTVPAFSGVQGFSVEAWARVEGDGGTFADIVAKQSTNAAGKREGWALFRGAIGGFSLERFVDDVNMKVYDKTVPQAGVWHHVVGTYDGNTMSIFVDGAVKDSVVDKSMMTDQPGVEGVIGNNLQLANAWIGDIDEVAIYERALTAPEVLHHYNVGAGTP
jgi:hypothetical protein